MDTATEVLTTKSKEKKQQNKNLIVNLLELILTKNNLIFLKSSIKFLELSKNQLKTTLINKIPTRLLGLEVKSDKKIKCHDIYY